MTPVRALLLALLISPALIGVCLGQTRPTTSLDLDIQRERQQSLLEEAKRYSGV
ncbi:hypothetical protein [Salinicola endophyticus]|uniref:hypothetical protein n=1 Tax=Salinicola endophyticus TaxID=1949083 RepID=UPI0013005764|nr:hypothetical protein [Salinicola endophyticus]